MTFLSELEEWVVESICSEPKIDSNGVSRSNYLDGHKLLSNMSLLNQISETIFEQASATRATHVAGLALGGCPLATAIGLKSIKSMNPLVPFAIRNTTKNYGQQGMLTLEVPEGSPVFLVDDVISSGATALIAIEKLKEVNIEPVGFAAVVQRGRMGMDRLEEKGLLATSLHTL